VIALPAYFLALSSFFWASGGINGLPTGGVNPVLVSFHVTFLITCADTSRHPTKISLL
jgi:hypothetical protein